MGCIGGKTTKDNIILIAVLYYFEGFVRAKTIINQYSWAVIRSSFYLRVEDMLDPVQTNRGIYISRLRATKMPSRRGMDSPGASVSSSRPHN